MVCFAHVRMIGQSVADDPYAYKGTMGLVQIPCANPVLDLPDVCGESRRFISAQGVPARSW